MRNLEPARSASHVRFSTFSSSDSMTRHGANLVLSIGACELAPGAPRLPGARSLSNRGMSLVAHRVISLRCGIWLLSGHSGLWRAVRPADLWVHGLTCPTGEST